jgi:mono/diheme cytochrome c family protein
MIAVQQFADAAAAAYGACADAPLLDLLDQRNRQRLKKVPSACARGSRVIARNGEIAMKLIDVAPAARVTIAASMCVVAGSANAQQIGSVQEGRQLAREVCGECHAIDNAADGSTNPNAPTFKVIANTPGMTSAALTVALQTTHVTMPNFVIKGDALQNIIAYILSLKEKN